MSTSRRPPPSSNASVAPSKLAIRPASSSPETSSAWSTAVGSKNVRGGSVAPSAIQSTSARPSVPALSPDQRVVHGQQLPGQDAAGAGLHGIRRALGHRAGRGLGRDQQGCHQAPEHQEQRADASWCQTEGQRAGALCKIASLVCHDSPALGCSVAGAGRLAGPSMCRSAPLADIRGSLWSPCGSPLVPVRGSRR